MKKMKIADQATHIKEVASYKYDSNMSKKESRIVDKMYKETEWNKLYLSILRLAADRIDTLVIVNPIIDNVSRLKKAGFKLQIERVPDKTSRQFGDKDAMRIGRIIVKW